MLGNPLDVTLRVVLRRGNRRRGYHLARLAPGYAMDRRFTKVTRRRRYVIRVNAAGWFRTQVWINGRLHRTTECYAEEEVRRLTRQFEREVADLVADGWADVTRTHEDVGTQTPWRVPGRVMTGVGGESPAVAYIYKEKRDCPVWDRGRTGKGDSGPRGRGLDAR